MQDLESGLRFRPLHVSIRISPYYATPVDHTVFALAKDEPTWFRLMCVDS